MTDPTLSFDVLVVGAGPAGMAFAIRLAQKRRDMRIAVIDKGASVGAHTLSGALLSTCALDALLPTWSESMPTHGMIQSESLHYLTRKHRIPLPIVGPLKQTGQTPIVSISHVCRWLQDQASDLGVEVYPGFSATQLCFDAANRVCGIQIGDRGLDQNGQPTPQHQPGMRIHAKTTVLAEGCHGTLSQQAIQHFQLRKPNCPQTYGLGIREVWQIDPAHHRPGHVQHTLGWPLSSQDYGGGFIYHLTQSKVVVGFVTALDYQNPTTDPHAVMQQFKTHPSLLPMWTGGKRLQYGAKALVEGGLQSLPQLHFPGGCLIGDAAGFLNAAQLKGMHTAMHSGMLAADALDAIWDTPGVPNLAGYTDAFENSPLFEALHRVRNVRPGFQRGQTWGLMHAAFDQCVLRGRAPWTLPHRHDHLQTRPKQTLPAIVYPKPDGIITFDKSSSLYLSHTQHTEGQPCHLKLQSPEKSATINWDVYGCPEHHYCPADVYHFDPQTREMRMQPSNCLHCKTCAIKDPSQNIIWTPPQGGEGPHYHD